MKTDDLKAQGLTDEQIQFVFAENSKDIKKYQDENEILKTDIANTKQLLTDANKEIEGYKEMDIAAIKKSADDWKQKYEDLEKQKAEEEYERKIDNYISGLNMNDEVHAEKLKSQIKEKELKFQDNKLIGGDDIVKLYKEKYPHVFGNEQKLKGIKIVEGADKKDIETTSTGTNYAKEMNQKENTKTESKFFK